MSLLKIDKGHPGETLLQIIRRRYPELFLNLPCGGVGRCGKCRVRLKAGGLSDPGRAERALLDVEELDSGIRLACLAVPETDVVIDSLGLLRKSPEVMLPPSPRDRSPEAENAVYDDPPLQRHSLSLLQGPKAGDPFPDLREYFLALVGDAMTSAGGEPPGPPPLSLPPSLLAGLSRRFADGDDSLSVLSRWRSGTWEIFRFESPEQAVRPLYGAAIDIGTTTVALSLIDLGTGETAASVSQLNAQETYGADVVSRMAAAKEERAAALSLAGLIREQISGLLDECRTAVGCETGQLPLAVCVGNPVMLHLFLGLDPTGLAAAPFRPVVSSEVILSARETGLPIAEDGILRILPALSAFVGADITAGIVALTRESAPILERELLIDIGTNGEMVLGHEGHLWVCSTAAGPALEGAGISCGMAGIAGAVNRILWDSKAEAEAGLFEWRVIGGGSALGLCGSGLLDAVALLLDAAVIDRTGRIQPRERLELSGRKRWASLIEENEKGRSIRLLPPTRSDSVVLTQRDIRELQNAKAAIATGITLLSAEAGLGMAEIDRCSLAGGFGSALSRDSILRLGLIPQPLSGKLAFCGDTAGSGARAALLSREALGLSRRLSGLVKEIELAALPSFQEMFLENMYFPPV